MISQRGKSFYAIMNYQAENKVGFVHFIQTKNIWAKIQFKPSTFISIVKLVL